MAVWQQRRNEKCGGSRGMGFATTLDGGKTWRWCGPRTFFLHRRHRRAGHPPLGVYRSRGDHLCGVLLLPAGPAGHQPSREGFAVSTSQDEGQTWSDRVVVHEGLSLDKEAITADARERERLPLESSGRPQGNIARSRGLRSRGQPSPPRAPDRRGWRARARRPGDRLLLRRRSHRQCDDRERRSRGLESVSSLPRPQTHLRRRLRRRRHLPGNVGDSGDLMTKPKAIPKNPGPRKEQKMKRTFFKGGFRCTR